MQRSGSRALAVVAGMVVACAVAGCGSASPDHGAPLTTDTVEPVAEPDAPAAPGLGDGPITLIALGDSLTAGEGDDSGRGYVGRIGEAITALPGRSGSSVVNFGASGWDSTMMVDGQEGSPAELGAAVAEVTTAVADGRAALVTVLIGSNDLWYLYEYGTPEGTTPTEEDTAAQTYRTNLDRTVTELTDAGAVVVLGLPDDQSVRPAVADIDRLHGYLPDVTVDEVQLMSVMAVRLDRITEEVAADHRVRTVDTNAAFWADKSKMADDGIHPNGDGYTDLARLWLAVIHDLT